LTFAQSFPEQEGQANQLATQVAEQCRE